MIPRSLPRRTLLSGVATATLLLPRRALGAPLDVLASDAVYFQETGHTVSGPFLRFFRQYGLDAFGFPISEAFEDGGVLNQYFQRARFELQPDGAVRLGLLGVELGGAEPAPAPAAAEEGVVVVPETGHTLAGAFLSAYREWKATLGPPVGPERVSGAGDGYVQYFANARLEYDPFGGLRRGLLGQEVAAQRGVGVSPVARPSGAVLWSEYLGALAEDEADRRALAARVTLNAPFVPAFGQRWIVVNLAQQRVTAFEHTKQVFTDLISSGRTDKGLSTKGVFAINKRVANETMDSTTIGYPLGHPKYYKLENVLYTQYYNGGEALHYAWWHNSFGTPQSYGCINMRLATAKWFWDWATVGSPVIVA
jgi:hypothetical protein